jgi:hypothetical protein
MTGKWVVLDRESDPWKHSSAIECGECGALCASPEAAQKHLEWHEEQAKNASRVAAIAGLIVTTEPLMACAFGPRMDIAFDAFIARIADSHVWESDLKTRAERRKGGRV